MIKENEICMLVRPEWVKTARTMLNKKEFTRFALLIMDLVENGTIEDDGSKAYKLITSMNIVKSQSKAREKYVKKCERNEAKRSEVGTDWSKKIQKMKQNTPDSVPF